MHPALAILITFAAGAAVFWLVLSLVDFLQKRKKKNVPALDPAVDDYSDERGSTFHDGDGASDAHH